MISSELEAQLERLHPESFGWALACCRQNEMEAEDVLQTAYLKVVSGKARFEGRSSLKTWLFGVIRRTAQEASRRQQTREKHTLRLVSQEAETPVADGPEHRLAREELRVDLLRIMENLSERQQEILHLVFYQEMTIEEAAGVMKISLGSARTHYERGKGRLRALLKEETGGERAATGP
jgi:RNA polymerase sigma-70 factor (ECF subfamily)